MGGASFRSCGPHNRLPLHICGGGIGRARSVWAIVDSMHSQQWNHSPLRTKCMCVFVLFCRARDCRTSEGFYNNAIFVLCVHCIAAPLLIIVWRMITDLHDSLIFGLLYSYSAGWLRCRRRTHAHGYTIHFTKRTHAPLY